MVIFGGVDVEQKRFNDVFSYDCEKHSWSVYQTLGDIQPQARTFHRAVAYNHIMYILGGFDGSRLNDMHLLPLPRDSKAHKQESPLSSFRRPASSSASGVMQTVPSDLVRPRYLDYLCSRCIQQRNSMTTRRNLLTCTTKTRKKRKEVLRLRC